MLLRSPLWWPLRPRPPQAIVARREEDREETVLGDNCHNVLKICKSPNISTGSSLLYREHQAQRTSASLRLLLFELCKNSVGQRNRGIWGSDWQRGRISTRRGSDSTETAGSNATGGGAGTELPDPRGQNRTTATNPHRPRGRIHPNAAVPTWKWEEEKFCTARELQ